MGTGAGRGACVAAGLGGGGGGDGRGAGAGVERGGGGGGGDGREVVVVLVVVVWAMSVPQQNAESSRRQIGRETAFADKTRDVCMKSSSRSLARPLEQAHDRSKYSKG